MASVHPMVTVQSRRMIFCVHTQDWVGLVAYAGWGHIRLEGKRTAGYLFIINFFRWLFCEYTEANATSLIPLDTVLPEICSFIIGFNCIVWTKMRSSAAH